MRNGSGCKACAIYPNCTAEYRGSRCAAIRSQFGLGDPMTNADRIRSMSDDEMTKWIVKFMNEVLQANNMADRFELDANFAVDMNIWLKKPYKEEKT